MRTIILLAISLFWAGVVHAQVGSSISADGSAPNNNAMLDVQSPATGDGKGILIPRVTLNQRTNANASLAGGLLDSSGNLRGGAAQGLIVYQTDGSQGLYFNTSQIATPAWVYLGSSTTNYLPLTGGTMSGPLNMGAQIVSNVADIDFNTDSVSVGRGANALTEGAAAGYLANGFGQGAALGKQANGSGYGTALGFGAVGTNFGVAIGRLANGSDYGQAIGFFANGYDNGVAIGRDANGTNFGAAVGFTANGSKEGVAIGDVANGYNFGVAVGQLSKGTNFGAAVGSSANGSDYGAAVGDWANGYDYGAAVGYLANGTSDGTAIGRQATGSYSGVAVGYLARGTNAGVAVGYVANGNNYGVAVGLTSIGRSYGAAVGYDANAFQNGAAVGWSARGDNYGAAVGSSANGSTEGVAIGDQANGARYGVAIGYQADGARTNVAIGWRAIALDGTNRIAIGKNVTNTLDDTAVLRGALYLDGGSSNIYYRPTFGSGAWSNKAFEIDHPLDPENKILRHFCLEGPQVWNVYAGNAQLVNGRAEVQLPDYYSALNLVGSEIYSLTPVGGLALLAVGAKVKENRFIIIGDKDAEVSWTIKVLRNDPGCLVDLRRRPVEQRKNELETGN